MGREGGAVHDVKADELAWGELVGLLTRIGGCAMDGDARIDDDGARLGADDGALDAARAAEDGLDVLATGGDDVDAACVCGDGADEAFAGGHLDGRCGNEVDFVACVGHGELDEGGLDSRRGHDFEKDTPGNCRVDAGRGVRGDHARG